MHVLVIPSWYKNRSNPFLGTFFEEQARGLMAHGCKVSMFFIGYKPFSFTGELQSEEYDDNGLLTIHHDIKGIIPRSREVNYSHLCKQALKLFNSYVEKNGRPDILHAHSVYWAGIIARYISQQTGIPYVITEHLTNFITGGISTTDKYYARKVFLDSSANICVSNSFRGELSRVLDIPESRFYVISNMVSPLFFENHKVLGISQGDKKIFFTNAFFSPRKNLLFLIDSFSIYLKTFPDSELRICGDIVGHSEADRNYKNEILTRISQCKLEDKIILLGLLGRNEIKMELDRCHVFLLASSYETFGVVIIESLAAGRPVIVADSGGPRDIVTNKNGVILRAPDANNFAQAMISMVSNYSMYDQLAISDECKKHFGEQAIVEKLLALYGAFVDVRSFAGPAKLKVLHLFNNYPGGNTLNWLYNILSNTPNTNAIVAAKKYTKNNFYNDTFTYIDNPLSSITDYKEKLSFSLEHLFDKFFCFIAEKLISGLKEKLLWSTKTLGVQLAHAHFADVGCEFVDTIKQLNLPLVVSFYGYDYEYLPHIKPEYIRRYKELFLKADKFICEGSNGVNILKKMGCSEEKIEVVKLGVAIEKIGFHERKKDPSSLQLVQIASFREKKGHIYSLKAFHAALKECPNMSLTFVGDGEPEIRTALYEYVLMNDLEKHVFILDEIDFDELHYFLSGFDVFIHPSCYSSNMDCEGGAPIVLLDAQACGMPVIATTHCDIPDEVLQGKTGLLTPEKDIEALASSISYFYKMDNNEYRRFSTAARKHVEDNYSISKNAALLKEVYNKLLLHG